MSQVIGTINSLNGLFFIKDAQRNITATKNGNTLNNASNNISNFSKKERTNEEDNTFENLRLKDVVNMNGSDTLVITGEVDTADYKVTLLSQKGDDTPIPTTIDTVSYNLYTTDNVASVYIQDRATVEILYSTYL